MVVSSTMEKPIPSQYYHILNRANGKDVLFSEEDNCFYFLKKYQQHIHPIVHTLAYALMGNHFHLVVQIRGVEELKELIPASDQSGFRNLTDLEQDDFLSKMISKKFSNCFNSYAKAFNKKYKRHGSLFQRPFKRHLLHNTPYLLNAIAYVHSNPVHHGFCDRIEDWPFSSYSTMLSQKPTLLARQQALDVFEGPDHFTEFHQEFSLTKQARIAETFEA